MNKQIISAAIVSSLIYSQLAVTESLKIAPKGIQNKEFTDPVTKRKCSLWPGDIDVNMFSGISSFAGKPPAEQHSRKSDVFSPEPDECQEIGGSDEEVGKIHLYKMFSETNRLYRVNRVTEGVITKSSEKIAHSLKEFYENQEEMLVSGGYERKFGAKYYDPASMMKISKEVKNSVNFSYSKASEEYNSKAKSSHSKSAKMYAREVTASARLYPELLESDDFDASFKRDLKQLAADIYDDVNFSDWSTYALNPGSPNYSALNLNIYNFIDEYGNYVLQNAKIGATLEKDYYFNSQVESHVIREATAAIKSFGFNYAGFNGSLSDKEKIIFSNYDISSSEVSTSRIHWQGITSSLQIASLLPGGNFGWAPNFIPVEYSQIGIWELPLENIDIISTDEAQTLKRVLFNYTKYGMEIAAEKVAETCRDGGTVVPVLEGGRSKLDAVNMPQWQCSIYNKFVESRHDDIWKNTQADASRFLGEHQGSQTKSCPEGSFIKGLGFKHYYVNKSYHDIFGFRLICSGKGLNPSHTSEPFSGLGFLNYQHQTLADIKADPAYSPNAGNDDLFWQDRIECKGDGNVLIGLKVDRHRENGHYLNGYYHDSYRFHGYCSDDKGADALTLAKTTNALPNYHTDPDYQSDIVHCVDHIESSLKPADALKSLTFDIYRQEAGWFSGSRDSLNFSTMCAPFVPTPLEQ